MAVPVFTTQPQATKVYEGQAARFSVVASGATSYQWQTSPDNSAWSDVGTDSSSYTISPTVRTTHNAIYVRCVATNLDGSTNSDSVQVEVWNPLALAGKLAAWLDPSQGIFTERTGASATTVTSDGGVVGTWRARNGTINGTAGSDAARPIYRATGFYGTPSLQFDGTNDALSFAADLGASTNAKSYYYVLAAVAAPISSSVNHTCFTATVNGSTSGRITVSQNGSGTGAQLLAGGRRLDANSFASVTAASVFLTTEPMIVGAEFLYASSDIHIRKNGRRIASNTSFQTDGATSASDSTSVWVGAAGDGTVQNFSGFIGTMVLCNDQLTDTELADAERFIAWKSGMPVPDWNLTTRTTGVLSAATADHYTVAAPSGGTITEGDPTSHRYRHGTMLAWHYNRLHLMYNSSGTNEDAGGQQTCYCYSDDYGATWSTPVTLIPSQSAFNATGGAFANNTHICYTRRWVIADGRLFATVGVDRCSGDPPGFLGITGVALAAREVLSDGTFGTAVRISVADYTTLDSKPKLDYDSGIADLIYAESKLYGSWGGSHPDYTASDWPGWMTDGTLDFAELSTIQYDDSGQNLVRIMREFGTSKTTAYAVKSEDGGATFGTIKVTNIPTAPSFKQLLRLTNGDIALVGNVDSNRTELYLAILDPIWFQVQSAVAIRTGISPTPTYAGTYKNGGAAYPGVIQRGNYLYVAYSLQKETIGFSRVLIPGLADNDNDMLPDVTIPKFLHHYSQQG